MHLFLLYFTYIPFSHPYNFPTNILCTSVSLSELEEMET